MNTNALLGNALARYYRPYCRWLSLGENVRRLYWTSRGRVHRGERWRAYWRQGDEWPRPRECVLRSVP